MCQLSRHCIIQRMCASYMFGDCYMFTKIICSLCTEIDKPALKYLARYTGLKSIFDWITPQFSYFLTGLALAGTCRLANPHAYAYKPHAYKLNETGKWLKEILLMFSYIWVVSRGYILLISICPLLKIGKLYI